MSSNGFSRGATGRRTLAISSSRRPQSCGDGVARAHAGGSCQERGRRQDFVANALGRCTRVACATVVILVLLGDNTSARSSLGSDHTAWRSGTAPSPHSRHLSAWQLFAPKAPPSKRRVRLKGSGGGVVGARGVGSAVSPAQMYRVSRGSSAARGTQQQQQTQGWFTPNDGGSREDGSSSSIERLQSPRSAELLTVYASAPPAAAGAAAVPSSSAPVISAAAAPSQQLKVSSNAESIGSAVVSQGGGEDSDRPSLPVLSQEDLTQLRAGQRVQKQTRTGGSGSGSVVVDVRADPDVVMRLLTKYEDYAEMIDTVRQCEVFPQGDSADTRKVEVTVSRFKLHIRVVMTLLRERNMIQFELDPDCTKAGRAVLREATGFFYVESPPDRPGFSRVWMMAKVDVNRFVPGAIVDYAAGRALPRASNWIKPTCEAAQRRKLRAAAAAAAASG